MNSVEGRERAVIGFINMIQADVASSQRVEAISSLKAIMEEVVLPDLFQPHPPHQLFIPPRSTSSRQTPRSPSSHTSLPQ